MKEDIKVIVFDIYGVVVDKEGNLQDYVLDILKKLKKKDIKLVACSNSSRRMLDIWDSKYNFFKYFDDTILAEDIRANKPEHEMFMEIINRNNSVLPQNILFVDDKEINVLAGEAEGLIGLRFINPEKFSTSLEKLGIL